MREFVCKIVYVIIDERKVRMEHKDKKGREKKFIYWKEKKERKKKEKRVRTYCVLT